MSDQANDNTCVVCFKNVLYYSIGECDHPVCFECSTRMRVLCLQNECPICRQDLARVVFTDTVQLYKDLRNQVFTDRLFERQFKIGFCSEDIKQAYERLLENCCNICDKTPPFRNFSMLNDHMRKVHEKYYCDLCVKHLRIFTSERKCYTRQELAHHRRKGDLDDTSHRGHPLCEFCEERFMDADELYRHLRKEHLYCHLCDADGKNLYYASHSALAHHFRTDHYLCEEGECAGQHLTAVFRSEIDLKAHKATVHQRGMNRGATRQARTLELQFNITPHPQQRAPRSEYNRLERLERPPSPPPPPPTQHIDTHSNEQFPRLSAAPPQHNLLQPGNNKAYKAGAHNLARTDRNFPTLGGAPAGPSRPAPAPASASKAPTVAATILRNAKPGVSIHLHSQPASASNFRLTPASGNRISIPPRQRPVSDDDFPSLSVPKDDHPSLGASTPQPPKVTLINSEEMQSLKSNQPSSQHKKLQQMSSEAFPALSSSSTPAAPPQWIAVSKSKAKQKPTKPEPPPQPREPSFNPVADFPTLPVNMKPKKKPTPQPPPPSPPAQLEIKPTKKEKKKLNQLAKKENIVSDAPLVNGLDKKYARDPSFTEVTINNNNDVGKIKTIEMMDEAAHTHEKNRNGKGDFALASKDYPPLNPKSANARSEPSALTKKTPNGSVPPGFAPPGFKVRPTCNGMTFTNSSGQTFSAPVHSYISPPDFERRNRDLVNKLTVALGGPAAVQDFKVASRDFRQGTIVADDYYKHCSNAMGSQLDDVFPELVALLPDIGKQQELVVGRSLPGLDVCATCGQLVPKSDAGAHLAAHWPPLAPR